MDRFADLMTLLGRSLIAGLFIAGAVQKLVDPGSSMSLLTGLALPSFLIWPALGFNALSGALLLAGWAVRPVALLLSVYCMVTSVFHLIPDDPWQMSIFVKNWAIAGGCLVLAAHGPGRYVLGRPRIGVQE